MACYIRWGLDIHRHVSGGQYTQQHVREAEGGAKLHRAWDQRDVVPESVVMTVVVVVV